MKGMASAQEFIQAPPPGQYPISLDAVEAGFSKSNESHLKISFSVIDGPFKGSSGFHYIGTDGGTKYGAVGKKHLRALGVPIDTDAEIPDSVLASKLQGLRLMASCGNEPRQKRLDENDPKSALVTQMEFDPKTGKQVAMMNLSILGFIRQPGERVDLGLPGQLVPQGQPQYVPQGVPQGMPQQQYAAPGGQQLPPGYVVQQQAPQQYVAPQGPPGFVPGAVPTGLPPGFQPPQPGYVAAPAPAPWANGAPGGAPVGVPQGVPPTGVRPG